MIPNNWNQITVEQFIELRELGTVPSSSVTERYIDTLLTVTDIDLEVIEDMSLNELTDHVKSISWIHKEPGKKYANKVGDYQILPFKKITWGMFIDLEYYYSQNYIEHLPTICGILYRRINQDKWEHLDIEPYNYNPIERGEAFKQLPITSVYGVVTSYLDFRNDLINVKYKNLFENSFSEEEEDTTNMDAIEKKEYEEAKREEERFNKWAYENVTLQLAGGDVTKMDTILNMGLIYVLNMLSMKADLG